MGWVSRTGKIESLVHVWLLTSNFSDGKAVHSHLCRRSPRTAPHGMVSERGPVKMKLKEKLEVVPGKLCSENSSTR